MNILQEKMMCIDRYPFKRDAFFELGEKLSNNQIVFIIGPGKTGKTVCMKQLEDNYKTEQYYDFKKNIVEDILDKIDEVCDSIRNNKGTIYLLDGFSYTDYPDLQLEKIAEAYTDNPNSKTKIVVSSSQSVSLQYWAKRSFCENVGFVEVDFLKYHEWLRKNQIKVISDETYKDYLLGVKSFYDFKNLKDYLKECLDETTISNFNEAQVTRNNDIYGLTVDMLLDVLYTSVFSLQNLRGYDKISNFDEFEFMRSILFLYNYGLINVSYKSTNIIDRDIINDLKRNTIIDVENNHIISSKNQINDNINVTLNHPMFYVEIIKEIFKYEEYEKAIQTYINDYSSI